MKKQDDKFGDLWREQFQDAEATPHHSVWDRVETNLVGSEVHRYKKKLLYYKFTAAASILLALLFGSYSLYRVIHDAQPMQIVEEIAVDENLGPAVGENITSSDAETLASPDEKSDISDNNVHSSDALTGNILDNNIPEEGKAGITESNGSLLNLPSHESKNAANISLLASDHQEDVMISPAGGMENDHTGEHVRPQGIFHVTYEKPGRKYYLSKKVNPYDVAYLMPLEEQTRETDPKRLWAGVNFSSGIFNPNITYDGSPNFTSDAALNTLGAVETINSTSTDIQGKSNEIMSYKPEESSYNSDISFSYGVNFGYKFSKKFVLLGGLAYQHNYGSTTVNTYIEPTATHTKYANHVIAIERASPESGGLNTYSQLNSEVELNSIFEFVTLPVNIGYYLIDKKFKWMMTAGITTDIFIKNSIRDDQNLFDQIQYKNGVDSPYNPVYFNGKVGTMLNYGFLKNYQISLEPSYRIGLSDLTKENAAFNSRPSSFLISAGISYIF
jgi:hypothetical protein